MYRLAICEDDPVMRDALDKLCREILAEMDLEYEIAAFSSAEELDAAVHSENVDPFALLLLDIQLDGMSGMELARELRRRDDWVGVVFITNCEDYLREGYAVQPIQYLLKPVSREALAKAIQTDWKRNHRSKTILLRAGGKVTRLPAADVRYLESLNHSVILHLRDGERTFSLSLTETERLLPPGLFVRCHNSFLVNLEHIEAISRTEIALRDGTRVPVGRRYYKDFQSAFIQYINQ